MLTKNSFTARGIVLAIAAASLAMGAVAQTAQAPVGVQPAQMAVPPGQTYNPAQGTQQGMVFPQQQVGTQTGAPQVAVQPQVAPLPIAIPPLPPSINTKPGAGLPKEVFGAIVNEKYPLSPEQVRELNRLIDSLQQASTARTGPAPVPTTSTTRVSFAAGQGPQVVRVSAGTVSSLIFTDISGQPWNVERVVGGRPNQMELTYGRKDGPSNMFTINPLTDNVSTNIAIFLENGPAPIMMAVESGQKAVDFRLDVSVQARGPQASDPAISRGFVDSVPAELNDMVSGVTPANARALKVVASDVSDVQAWVIANRMFVRSKAIILAPAPLRVATGADGTKVFELPHAAQVLMSTNGTPGRVTLGGFPPPQNSPLAATNK